MSATESLAALAPLEGAATTPAFPGPGYAGATAMTPTMAMDTTPVPSPPFPFQAPSPVAPPNTAGLSPSPSPLLALTASGQGNGDRIDGGSGGGSGSNSGSAGAGSSGSSGGLNSNSPAMMLSNELVGSGISAGSGGGGSGGSGSGGGGGLPLLSPPISPAGGIDPNSGGGGTSGTPFPARLRRPSRRRGDSECSDYTRGSTTPGSGKRRRRDGLDVAGQRVCVFKLTTDENVSFMNRIRDLYDSEQLCDVTLRVGEKDFRAHKMVLACSKSFLGTMMRSGMREADQDVIELKDISADQFKILLDYIYNKAISVPSFQLTDLLCLANQYQVEGLKFQMCDALLTNLDHDNACSVFATADNHQCRSLKEEAFSKIVQHFALATRSDGWTALTKEQVSEVLSSDLVLDCDESVVFDAACRWLLLESSPWRRQLAPEVLAMVRFPLMDAGLLSDVIKHHEATKGPECQQLITEAWEHHALKAVGREGLPGTRTKQRRRSCSFKKHTLLKEHQDAVSALAVVNGKLVSGSWDTSIKVWDPQSWTTERTLSDHTGPVRCFAQCAGRLLSGSDDGSIKVWNTDTWSLVRSLDDHSDAVNAAIDCAGRLASGSDDGTIKLWNTSNWQCEVTIHQHQANHTCGVLALATCGDFLVSGSDGGIKVWNTHNWTCHKEVLGHGDEIWALAVVGDRLISGSIDSTIRVWETQTWGCEKLLEDHAGPVYALTVLEGKLVSASSDHTIRVWGPDWGCCRTLECSGVWSLNVFNDRLVSGSLDNAVKVWGA